MHNAPRLTQMLLSTLFTDWFDSPMSGEVDGEEEGSGDDGHADGDGDAAMLNVETINDLSGDNLVSFVSKTYR